MWKNDTAPKELHTMKKTFKIVNLDCANCARKMEDSINRLEGIRSATVSFMTQKLTIDADDDRFDELLQAAVNCCKRVDRDVDVVVK